MLTERSVTGTTGCIDCTLIELLCFTLNSLQARLCMAHNYLVKRKAKTTKTYTGS